MGLGQVPVAALLVHGTWASEASWTGQTSDLSVRLQSEFDDIQVESVPWSGRNRFLDRLNASTDIEQKALRMLRGGRALFLIGHSHGGSTIAYALNRSEELRTRVVGAIFFSTPFVALAPRPGYRTLYRAVIVIATMLTFMIGGFALGHFGSSGSWDNDSQWRNYIALSIVAALCPMCVWLALQLRAAGWIDRLAQSVLDQARQFETVNVSGPPLLFVRTTGDEVAMLMGSLQLLCYISNAISTYMAWAVDKLAGMFGWLWRRPVGKISLVILAASAVFAATLAGVASRLFGFWLQNTLDILNPLSTNWGNVESLRFSTLPALVEVCYRTALGILDLSGLLFISAAALLLSGIVLAIVFSTVAYTALGRFDPRAALMLEMAAEPTPRGEQAFVHLSWDQRAEERADGTLALRHSRPYSDSDSLDAVCGWISRALNASEHQTRMNSATERA